MPMLLESRSCGNSTVARLRQVRNRTVRRNNGGQGCKIHVPASGSSNFSRFLSRPSRGAALKALLALTVLSYSNHSQVLTISGKPCQIVVHRSLERSFLENVGLEFLGKRFSDAVGTFPERARGGVFSRVFAFLAALVLCLSVLTVFAQNVAAELTITNIKAERKDNSTITFSWTFSENVISYSYFFQEKGSNEETQGLSFSGETAGEKTLDISISGGFPGIQTNAEVRVRIKALSFTPSVITSAWSDYVPTASNECYSQSTDDLKSDCLVLDTLYDDTGGANWADRTNWKSANSLDTWHGITVRDGRVIRIKLYNNNLTGTISDLSALTGLVELDLGNDPSFANLGTNNLSGTIPDLSALTKLNVLMLDGNSLSGSIPDLSSTELSTLLLNNNNIGGEHSVMAE